MLQRMDTSGQGWRDQACDVRRESTQGCKVVTFKTPSTEELDHDFLWRVHQKAPAKDQIGIFNRSHTTRMCCDFPRARSHFGQGVNRPGISGDKMI
jgi:polyphosphate kinase 2 (PPK2 family)